MSEYGVHWNFFITLAALPVLGVVAQRLYRHMPFSAMGLLATMGKPCPKRIQLSCTAQAGLKQHSKSCCRQQVCSRGV